MTAGQALLPDLRTTQAQARQDRLGLAAVDADELALFPSETLMDHATLHDLKRRQSLAQGRPFADGIGGALTSNSNACLSHWDVRSNATGVLVKIEQLVDVHRPLGARLEPAGEGLSP
jgi:hypothetical protein